MASVLKGAFLGVALAWATLLLLIAHGALAAEPNETPSSASGPLTPGVRYDAGIEESGDRDYFIFYSSRSGARATVRTANDGAPSCSFGGFNCLLSETMVRRDGSQSSVTTVALGNTSGGYYQLTSPGRYYLQFTGETRLPPGGFRYHFSVTGAGITAEPQKRDPRAYFHTRCGDSERYKPRRINYTCGGASAGGRLSRMRWSSWTRNRATGRGLTTVRVFGVPRCSFFCYRSYRARVTLNEPRYCPSLGRRVFRRIVVRYRDNTARRRFAVRFRCDGRFVGTP